MGIILFKLIAKYHPYVRDICDNKSFIRQLAANKVKMPEGYKLKYSLKFQYFFNLVLRMIAKKESERVDFDEIYEYIEEEEIFDSMKKEEADKSEEICIDYKKYIIT
jgi:hypothetical protein